jgi:hypothetical protein
MISDMAGLLGSPSYDASHSKILAKGFLAISALCPMLSKKFSNELVAFFRVTA